MIFTSLIPLGRAARSARLANQRVSYLDAIRAIDAEAAALRGQHPEVFIDEQSPEYRRLVAEWDSDRVKRMVARYL